MKEMKFSIVPELGTMSEQDSKRYFSTVGLATCVLMLVSNLSALVLSLAVEGLAPWVWEHALLSQLLNLIPLYGLGFPCFFLVLSRLPKDFSPKETMGGKQCLKGLCVAVTLLMAGNYVGNFFTSLFSVFTGATPQNPVETATVGQAWWINLIFVGILAPIVEEIFFRKILCDRLLPLGEGYAVVLSAAIFGLAHGNFFQFFYAFALGLLFALIYVQTGRLRYSVLYHILINVTGGVLAAWISSKLGYLLTEEGLNELFGLAEAADLTALGEFLQPYLLPLILLLIYNWVMLVMGICGIVFLVKGRKRIRFAAGRLCPAKDGKVANVFCNVGVAAALTVFTLIFLVSLL